MDNSVLNILGNMLANNSNGQSGLLGNLFKSQSQQNSQSNNSDYPENIFTNNSNNTYSSQNYHSGYSNFNQSQSYFDNSNTKNQNSRFNQTNFSQSYTPNQRYYNQTNTPYSEQQNNTFNNQTNLPDMLNMIMQILPHFQSSKASTMSSKNDETTQKKDGAKKPSILDILSTLNNLNNNKDYLNNKTESDYSNDKAKSDYLNDKIEGENSCSSQKLIRQRKDYFKPIIDMSDYSEID